MMKYLGKKGNLLSFKNKKYNNGITLIALVITIIVLLILAAVTINTLTGENGIITRASQAAEQTEIAEEKEAIGVAYAGVLADNNGNGVSAEELQEELENNGYNATVVDNGDGTLTVTFESGREYTIDENGSVTGPTETDITATMKIVGEKVTEPPVPSGFTHTEGTVDTGYVIQDSDGNEFVWVPVDKNQKIQVNVTSKSGDIESLVLTDPYGDDVLTLSNVGTSYSNTEIEPTINGPYRLTITVGEETKKVFLNVHSLYAVDSCGDWYATEEYAIKWGYESLDAMVESLGYSSVEELMMDGSWLKEYYETEDYTNSVNSNGGFYIGRYEASYENGKVASKVSTSTRTVSSITLENGMLWNYISLTDALSYTKSMYTSAEFTSSLLTGAAWDRTLGWLYETGAVTWQEIILDSSSWGHYSDDSFSGTTGLINTGSMEQTKANNIYDFAGNLWEWTTEVYGTSYRVCRGRWL